MFTHRNNEKDNERGALMIEAIALLGLMTLMSPMVVRQTADRTAEMEEVAIAGQMKEIKEALNNWIEANYQEKAKTFSAAGNTDTSFAVSAADLAPYLPATYLNGSNFRGNKLIDGFDVGVRAQCTEVSKDDGSECSVANGCYSLTNGAIAAIPAGAKCSRYKMTGVVLSKAEGNAEIDDRRASRIASMIGADGGYMRTTKLVQSLYNGDENEMKKIVGSQGMWEGDVTSYIPGIATNVGGKVAATTIFSSGFSGDYLYRKKVDGLPGANSMFTDLDMGGATECEGDGCHKINNAGGLEVVGGKILIRSFNTNDDQGISSGNSFAKIALATDNSHLNVDNSLELSTPHTHLTMTGNNTEATGSLELGTNSSHLKMTYEEGDTFTYLNSQVLELNGRDYLNLNSADISLNADNDIQMAGDIIDLNARSEASIGVSNNTSFMLMDDSGVTIDAEETAGIFGNNIDVAADNYMNISGSYTNVMGTNHVIIGTIHNGERPALKITPTEYKLQTEGTIINGKGEKIQLMAGWSAKSHTTYGAASLNLLNLKTTFTLTNSTLQGGIGNNSSSFALTNSNFSVNIGLVNNTARHQMLLNNGRLSVSYLNAGNISDKYTVAYLASVYSNRAKLVVNGDTGAYDNTNSINNDTSITNALVTIDDYTTNSYGLNIENNADNTIISHRIKQTFSPYYTHSGDTKYDHFRVDPSYMSVMNDIKITSRGGARLSEALPNYILKGIYELSNSYKSGPWPCRKRPASDVYKKEVKDSNCTYSVPYYSLKALGLSSGGWEFNCGANGNGSHPAAVCLGNKGNDTYNDGDYITISYYNSSYQECDSDSFCWAHPFLGAVPAPGRKVSEDGVANADGLAAYDEGVCPDGYQAVITVTPTVFELGKVQFVNSSKRPSDSAVSYNPGWQNYKNGDIQGVTGLMQMSTKLGLIVEQIVYNNQLYGWKIAMGTVTPVSTDLNSDGYIWNAGGISANGWSAIAHTYCYFNPSRFTMPNMVIKDSMIQTADNPSL